MHAAVTPFREWWSDITRLRAEWPPGELRVSKTKAHATLKSVQHSPHLLWQRFGNTAADVCARAGAALHPNCPMVEVRLARTRTMVGALAKFVGRVGSFVLKHSLLPVRLARPFTIPHLPAHTIASGPELALRCVKCYKLAGRLGRVVGRCVPLLFVPHHPLAVGAGIFCARCGAYSFKRCVRLMGSCPARPTSGTVARRLAALLAGEHPVSRVALGVPYGTAEPAELFSLLL